MTNPATDSATIIIMFLSLDEYSNEEGPVKNNIIVRTNLYFSCVPFSSLLFKLVSDI